MYRHTTKIICDICGGGLNINSDDFGLKTDSQICEGYGWASIRRSDDIEHICSSCIKIVGYAHAFGLVEAALKQFDLQTYNPTCELIWRVGDKYLSYGELVNQTHPKEKDNICD